MTMLRERVAPRPRWSSARWTTCSVDSTTLLLLLTSSAPPNRREPTADTRSLHRGNNGARQVRRDEHAHVRRGHDAKVGVCTGNEDRWGRRRCARAPAETCKARRAALEGYG
jgi:hypothetical protein